MTSDDTVLFQTIYSKLAPARKAKLLNARWKGLTLRIYLFSGTLCSVDRGLLWILLSIRLKQLKTVVFFEHLNKPICKIKFEFEFLYVLSLYQKGTFLHWSAHEFQNCLVAHCLQCAAMSVSQQITEQKSRRTHKFSKNCSRNNWQSVQICKIVKEQKVP